MRPQKAHAVYRPLPGKEDELRQLMADYVDTLIRLGFAMQRLQPARMQDEYLIETFEWADNDEQFQEEAGDHEAVRPISQQMTTISAIPNMKEIQNIHKMLKSL